VKPNPFIPGDMDKTAWKITTNVSEKTEICTCFLIPMLKNYFLTANQSPQAAKRFLGD
jgi:hypothetical protein